MEKGLKHWYVLSCLLSSNAIFLFVMFYWCAGEVKRVSIGVELLDNPSVLVLDEPTSGLDSALSIKIMSCLLREARKGSTIIVTLHQPCSQVSKSVVFLS